MEWVIKGLNEFPLISISAVQSTEVRRRDAERHTLICAYNKYRYHSSHVPRVFSAFFASFPLVRCIARKGSSASVVPSLHAARRCAAQGVHREAFGLPNFRDECSGSRSLFAGRVADLLGFGVFGGAFTSEIRAVLCGPRCVGEFSVDSHAGARSQDEKAGSDGPRRLALQFSRFRFVFARAF